MKSDKPWRKRQSAEDTGERPRHSKEKTSEDAETEGDGDDREPSSVARETGAGAGGAADGKECVSKKVAAGGKVVTAGISAVASHRDPSW